jgi:hypothetical protein
MHPADPIRLRRFCYPLATRRSRDPGGPRSALDHGEAGVAAHREAARGEAGRLHRNHLPPL